MNIETIIHLLRDSVRPASHAKLMDDAADLLRLYHNRLNPLPDLETGATVDEIDHLTLALEQAKLDRKKTATMLHDLQHAVREAMVRIEAEKFDLSKGASAVEQLFTKCAQRDLDILNECCGDFL